MILPIVTNLANFCLLAVRAAKILVKSVVELCQTTVSVTALQNNEMPIGVDHTKAFPFTSREASAK
jgi:hypothetical protein